MSSEQKRADLDAKAKKGETVVPVGTGGKPVGGQEHLAQGRSQGGQTKKDQKGAETNQEIGRKGGLSSGDKVEEGVNNIPTSLRSSLGFFNHSMEA